MAMAEPTPPNGEVTDSISQVNVKVLGDAPAIAMGNLFQATAQALALAAHNATNSQQQAWITMQAATTQGVATLYAIDTASIGLAAKKILDT
jgi:hypothetical protein